MTPDEIPIAATAVGDLHRQADAHQAAGRHAEALEAFQAAAALAPGDPVLAYNVASTLRLLGRPAEALAAYDRAVALNPRFAMAQHNRAALLLQLGDYRAGFQAFEWRKSSPGFDDPRYALPRQWAGQSLRGRRLFIYPEFFQGDLLQFGRYAALAIVAGAEVTLAAPRAMHAILRTMDPRLQLADEDAVPGDGGYDFVSALLSLPGGFGTTVATVPRGRYLQAEPERVARWRSRVGEGGFKVGVVWQGSAASSAPPVPRAFPLAAAAPLAGLAGVRLISLQKGPGLAQLSGLPAGMTVETLGEDFDPGSDLYLDTAAAVLACDLVVAMDGAIVHLAGALGAKTWLAVPQVPDWRWMDGRADTPWYPTVRLYRQTAFNDWGGVFAAMARDLRERPDA
ncbi:glycosyltransferase [Phenylobacterium sp.]|uniref:glycosyltransferase n=1 Tax=Phenylobacterium sp. TaxID=1871053 RepID=UPI0012004C95|nr:glycosyltransferase [Phenylobacterium sp.]THD65002.1 MAG: hypothetical protein E8A49_00365 [Phenylobacterium sp.]